MKKLLFIFIFLLLPIPAFAGEKEELTCKQELINKDMIILELQSQVLQFQYNNKQVEKQVVQEKLKALEPKKEEGKE
ncbi:MAG: hypothetical protein A2W22_06290 [Candidatus Levybacteria bacterium RBG_16_35_11]|nr:MAG: hypothetical protein A2W22_06290 [Candidatus Levybacteria bacterium RBG_16_35_11]